MEFALMASFIGGVIFAEEGVFAAGCVLAFLLLRKQGKWGIAFLLGTLVFLILSSHDMPNTQKTLREGEAEESGRVASALFQEEEGAERKETAKESKPESAIEGLRKKAEAFFDAKGGASFALLKRVLMGADVQGSFSLQEDMRTLGLAHLLAASGLHVHLLFSWGMAILAFSPLSRRQIAAILLVALFGYAAFLSFPASILRAWLFLCFQEVAIAQKRELHPAKAWLFALSLILLFQPYRVGDLGLRLSFLCAAAGAFVHAIEQIRERGGVLRRSFRRSLWISLFTLPVLAGAGIAQTPSTLLANLFAIPAFSVLFALGILSLVSSLLPLSFLSELCILFYRLGYGVFSLLLKGLTAIALPGYTFSFSMEGLALYVLLVFLLLAAQLGWLTQFKMQRQREDAHGFLFWQKRNRLCQVLSLWLIFTLFRQVLLLPFLPPSLEALDVGQGDCFLIRYGKEAVLVDTGGKKNYRTGENIQAEMVVSMLRERGINRLQGIFISHDDYDHDGNLRGIRQRIPVEEVITAPAADERTYPEKRIGSSHRQVNTGERWLLKNKRLPWEKPLIFTVLQAGQWDAKDKNNHGLVLFLEWGGGVLFMGDQEQDEAVAQALPSGIALLKVAHHGSRRGTSDALLSRICPEQAIISCGKKNRYGHPALSTLRRLQKLGVFWHRTDQEGTILYRENLFPWGKRLVAQTEKQQRTTALLWEMLWSLPVIVAIQGIRQADPFQNLAAVVGTRCKARDRYKSC